MPITDVAIKNLKTGDKPSSHFDAHGLYIEVQPKGGK